MTNSQGTHTYGYNDRYELETASGASSAIYAYDPVGNRTTVTEPNTPSSYTPNNLNQYSSVDSTTYSYDLNGNLVNDGDQIYEYDYENRLIHVTPAPPSTSLRGSAAAEAIYAYDPFGRRLTKTVASNIQTYLYDGDQIIETYPCDLTTGTCSLSQSFLYGPGIDEPLELVQHPSTATYYYHADGLGSIVALTDFTGSLIESYFYDPYGIPSTTSTLGNPFLFTGREYDSETMLYYYRNRTYHPNLGRFIQRDPMGYAASFDLYDYVGNNSINLVDPTGELPLILVPIIIAGAVSYYNNAMDALHAGGDYADINNAGGIGFASAALGTAAAPFVTAFGGGAASGFLNSVGLQLLSNGGNFSQIDRTQVLSRTASSALTSGVLNKFSNSIPALRNIGRTPNVFVNRSINQFGPNSVRYIARSYLRNGLRFGMGIFGTDKSMSSFLNSNFRDLKDFLASKFGTFLEELFNKK